MSWLLQKMCSHDAKYLAIKTIEYNSETITSTKVDHEVFCALCNKVLVPKEHYDDLKELLGGE